MSTVRNLAVAAAVAATCALGASSASANKLAEPAPKKKAHKKKTAKQVRAEKLKAVIDPDLGFGLAEPVAEPVAEPAPRSKRSKKRSKKTSRRARIRAARRAKQHARRAKQRSMKKAMSLDLGGRQAIKRTRAEETLLLDEQKLSDLQVKSAIEVNRESVDVCIERATARGKAPSGHANATFTVEPLGHVSHVRITASGAHARRIERCMKSAIKRWKFPTADAATHVEYPFVLDVAGTAMAGQ